MGPSRKQKKRQRSSGDHTQTPEPKRPVVKTIKDCFAHSMAENSEIPAQSGLPHKEISLLDMQKDIKQILEKVSVLPAMQIQLSKLTEDVDGIKAEMREHKQAIEFNQNDIAELQLKVINLSQQIEEISQNCQTKQLSSDVNRLQKDLVHLEAYGRRDNLILENVGEGYNEDCRSVVSGILKENLQIQKELLFTRVHRLGKKDQNKKRPIILRCHFYPDRELIWKNRRLLKGTGIIMREDYPESIEQDRRSLLPYCNAAKEKKMKTSLRGDTLLIEGQTYKVEDRHKLDEYVKPREVYEKQLPEKKLHLFFSNTSPFSNMFPAKIKIEGQNFHCAEQFYMYEKAKFVNDTVGARKILHSKDGKEAKYLGKKISVDPAQWLEQRAQAVMKLAVKEKFRQNPSLREVLLQTKGYTLAECNPHDHIWGIGLHLKSPDAEEQTKWRGKNLLGETLMEVRAELATG